MGLLLDLALGAAGTAVKATLRRGMRAGLLLGLALLALGLALTALALAAGIALARLTDPLTAALILAGAGLLLALILALAARGQLRQRDAVLAEVEANLRAQMAGADTQALLTPLLLALLAGFAVTGK